MRLKKSLFIAVMFGFSTMTCADESDFSQYQGKKYSVVKSEMIAQGWTVVPQAEDETSMDDEYPEITCGSGSMAICSVGFQNAEGSVAFVIEHSGHEIVVSGEY